MHISAVAGTNQAAEHGWAHLTRQVPPLRNRLAMSTRTMLAHVSNVAPYLYPYDAAENAGPARKKRKTWIPPRLRYTADMKLLDAADEEMPGVRPSLADDPDTDVSEDEEQGDSSSASSSSSSSDAEAAGLPAAPVDPVAAAEAMRPEDLAEQL